MNTSFYCVEIVPDKAEAGVSKYEGEKQRVRSLIHPYSPVSNGETIIFINAPE